MPVSMAMVDNHYSRITEAFFSPLLLLSHSLSLSFTYSLSLSVSFTVSLSFFLSHSLNLPLSISLFGFFSLYVFLSFALSISSSSLFSPGPFSVPPSPFRVYLFSLTTLSPFLSVSLSCQ